MSELTKVRKSVMDPTQVIPDMAGHNGKVLSNDGSLPRWIWGRIVGELARFSFETPPPGFFALDGSRIVNGKNDFSALANSGSRFITISGNDLILADAVDFGRGKGSSGRSVGSFEGDAIRNITGEYGSAFGTIGSNPHWPVGDQGSADSLKGAFYSGGHSGHDPSGGNYRVQGVGSSISGNYGRLNFDVSRVAPTAPENRPKSLTELVCIYHGVL